MAGDCELLLITTPDQEINEFGFYEPAPADAELKTGIFGFEKSVGFSEFYRAAQAGYQAQMKVDVYREEYGGESIVEIGNPPVRVTVLRTYADPKKPDLIELTLGNLATRNNEEYPEVEADDG